MARENLSEKDFEAKALEAVIKARESRRQIMIGCGDGLIYTVYPSGAGAFCARVPKQGGGYSFKKLTQQKGKLANLRREAGAIIREAKDRNEATSNRPPVPTFGEFADGLLERIRTRGKNDKRWLTVRTFRRELAPLDAVPLDRFQADKAIILIQGLKASDSKKHETARFLIQLFNEAIAYSYVPYNPCAMLGKLFKKPPREGFASVPAAELGAKFFSPLGAVPDFIKYFYLWTAFSALRLGSARSLLWEWIDFVEQSVTIPGDFMKMSRPFRLTLTPHMEQLLKCFRDRYGGNESAFVFYHWSADEWKINTGEAMPERYFQGPVTANCNRECTIHGLRKSARTWMAENGISFDVAEACLAHEEKSAVVRAYQKYDYFRERMDALTKWDQYVFNLLPGNWKSLLE